MNTVLCIVLASRVINRYFIYNNISAGCNINGDSTIKLFSKIYTKMLILFIPHLLRNLVLISSKKVLLAKYVTRNIAEDSSLFLKNNSWNCLLKQRQKGLLFYFDHDSLRKIRIRTLLTLVTLVQSIKVCYFFVHICVPKGKYHDFLIPLFISGFYTTVIGKSNRTPH